MSLVCVCVKAAFLCARLTGQREREGWRGPAKDPIQRTGSDPRRPKTAVLRIVVHLFFTEGSLGVRAL